MGDAVLKDLLNKIKNTPDSKLKSLDLYGNNLTITITSELSNFIEESKTIEFVGLSKNTLNTEDFLSKLFGSIG